MWSTPHTPIALCTYVLLDMFRSEKGSSVPERTEAAVFLKARGEIYRHLVFCVKVSTTAAAMASPSTVAVPRPSSSSATRLRQVARDRAAAVSVSSTRKVLCTAERAPVSWRCAEEPPLVKGEAACQIWVLAILR